MTRDPEREARQSAVEWALQYGEVVLDSPEQRQAKCDHPRVPHTWDVVCVDGYLEDGTAAGGYVRTCRVCGLAQTSLDGGTWQTSPEPPGRGVQP